jgi:glycosyltransferase involved in cell wall biosynthesis
LILRNKIKDFQPTVLYVHNTWFRSSLGIFEIGKKENLKVILKLHNFRYDCINALHFRNNMACHDCSIDNRKPGIINKCYESSLIKSIGLTNYSKKYFQAIKKNVDIILVLTEFHKKYLQGLGVESQKVFVAPNYLKQQSYNSKTKEKYFVYAGRISTEKGIDYLITEWKNLNTPDYKLKIIGDGPSVNNLLKNLKSKDNIEYLGRLSNKETIKIINASTAVINPTRLYEGQPNLLCEATLQKVISIFPDNGGIKEFFPENYPFIFNSHSKGLLMEKIDMVIKNPEIVKSYEELSFSYLSKKLDKKQLLDIFKKIL